MSKDREVIAFFRYGVPMFVVGFGIDSLLSANSPDGWVNRYSLYIGIALLAISAFVQWFYARRTDK